MLLLRGLIFAVLVTVGVDSAVILPQDRDDGHIAAANSSILRAEVDPRFHIKTIYSTTELLLDRSCMNAIKLLSLVTLRKWNTIVPKENIAYVDHIIKMSPAKGDRKLEVRFIVWGVFEIIAQNMRESKWFKSITQLFWDGQLVGSIAFDMTKTTLSLNDTMETTDISTQDSLSLTERSDVASFLNSTGQGASIFPEIQGYKLKPLKPIDRSHVYIALLNCLVYLGPYSNEDRVADFVNAAPGYSTLVRMDKLKPSRYQPPYFQYMDAKLITFDVAVWLRRREPIEETGFVVSYSGIDIGQIYVTNAIGPPI